MINKIGFAYFKNNYFIQPLKQETQERNTGKIQDISNVYYVPISFKGKPTLQEKLSAIEPLHCPVCGIEMLSQEKFEEIKNKKCETMVDLVNHIRANKQYLPTSAQTVLERIEHSNSKRPDLPAHISLGIIFKYLPKTEEYYISNLKSRLKKYSQEHNFSKNDIEKAKQISTTLNNYLNKEVSYNDCKTQVIDLISSLETEEKNDLVVDMNLTLKKIMMERFCFSIKDAWNTTPEERVKIFLSKLFINSVQDFHILKNNSARLNSHPVATCSGCAQSKNSIIDRNLTHEAAAINLARYFEDIYASEKLDNELKQHVIAVKYAAEIITNENVNLTKLTSPEFDNIKNEIFNSESISAQFDLVNEPGIPCACCNTTTLTYDEKLKLRAEVSQAKDMYELLDIVKRNSKHIKPLYQEVYKQYEKILEANPEITEDEMVEQLSTIYNNNLTDIFGKIADFAREKINDPRTSYYEKVTYEYYLSQTKDKYTDIKDVICVDDYYAIFNDTLANIDNKENKKSFYNLKDGLWENSMLQSLLSPPPEYSKGEESKLRDIINFTFAKASATGDHMVAKSNGGKNKQSNLMVLCNDCNKHKKNKKFSFWLNKEPAAVDNMQKYIYEVDKIIKERNLTKYQKYVKNFAYTVSSLMKGKVQFDVPSDK